MIRRSEHLQSILARLEQFPIVGLIGARQVGKTTLARSVAEELDQDVTHFDLENPRHLARLEDPMAALERLRGTVILDEIQLRPHIFSVLRVLVDRPNHSTRFLVLGSASPDLLRQGSQTLAGRIAYYELPPFDLGEVGVEAIDDLWLRGGFPLSYLAKDATQSAAWRREFGQTYLHRDLAELGISLPPTTVGQFWSMLAHYHGETWNAAELARAFGVTRKTVSGYLDILCNTFMARRLLPWHENLAKRQVKAPKVYLTDPGILHSLLNISTREDLLGHPKRGASWEGFAIQEVVRHLGARPGECFFWGLHTGAELDLVIVNGVKRLGFEIKLTTAPTTRRSMHTAMEALGLEELVIIHAGDEAFRLRKNIRAVPLSKIREEIKPLSSSRTS